MKIDVGIGVQVLPSKAGVAIVFQGGPFGWTVMVPAPLIGKLVEHLLAAKSEIESPIIAPSTAALTLPR